MFFGFGSCIKAQTLIDFETGSVFTCYNEVRIPGDEGTLFSFKDVLKVKTTIFLVRFK